MTKRLQHSTRSRRRISGYFLDYGAGPRSARLNCDISLRDDAHESSAVENRQPAELVRTHQLERAVQVLPGIDADDVARRHFADQGRTRVAVLGEHPGDKIPIRHDANEQVVFDYGQADRCRLPPSSVRRRTRGPW